MLNPNVSRDLFAGIANDDRVREDQEWLRGRGDVETRYVPKIGNHLRTSFEPAMEHCAEYERD